MSESRYPDLNANAIGGDWRLQRLPDGRVCELVDVQWGKDDGTEPPDSIPVEVIVTIDGHLETHRLLWTSQRLEAAYREAGLK